MAGSRSGFDPAAFAASMAHDEYPAPFARMDDFLTHPVFNKFHTETEMLRYLRRLESKDLSLTTSMIPLGSCTMKLNATTEMFPVTWPEFGRMHPFAPAAQAEGYRILAHELEKWLGEITGLPRREPATQRRVAGRIRGPARHPWLSRKPWAGAPQNLPHPHQRARHEPRQRGDGRVSGRPGEMRYAGQHRRGRPHRPRDDAQG